MAKRERTSDEIVIDWLNDSLWGEFFEQGIQLKKLIIKGGVADWLIVISAVKDGEAVVAFVGAKSILKAARRLNKLMIADELIWKEDRYAE